MSMLERALSGVVMRCESPSCDRTVESALSAHKRYIKGDLSIYAVISLWANGIRLNCSANMTQSIEALLRRRKSLFAAEHTRHMRI